MDITGRNQRERDHRGSSGTDAHPNLPMPKSPER